MLSPGGARGVEKAELNGNVDSDNNHGVLCATWFKAVLKRDFTTPLMELIPLGGTFEQFQSAELRAKSPQASFYRIA